MKTSKMKQLARGQDCTLRISGVCNYNPETTVLAHVGKHGSAKRNHDEEAVYACSDCHDAIDFRSKVFLSDSDEEQEQFHRVRKAYISLAKDTMDRLYGG